ncbi:MAG: glycosyltransferase family 39 protein [Cyanobacteria bacterium]|nr:glycosyltransferase family 39 protein [Cyanobacteriota bacterium]
MPQLPSAWSLDSCASRHYTRLACLVLLLTACNVFLRLGSETVTEWDESLYATSAAEMIANEDWIVTTRGGVPDYYNSKPPLNTWLIAASFKMFGVGIWSMRLPSAFAGLGTVALLMWWARRAYSPTLAIGACLVMATCFAALYVHSARTANPDALFTLLTLSIVVILWRSRESPATAMWLGPILAACFLLKGAAVLLPGLIAAGGLRWSRSRSFVAWPGAVAAAGLLLPSGGWAYLRWKSDGTAFFDAMVAQDLIGPTVRALEGHTGPIWFYLTVLAKYQYDWIALAVLAWCLSLPNLTSVQAWIRGIRWREAPPPAVLAAAALFVVPSAMQTKTTWYANPLLPFFSLAIAAIVVRAARRLTGGKLVVLAVLLLSTLAVAEARIWWHSFNRRDLAHSDQGLLLENADAIRGHYVARSRWTHADRFVLAHLIGSSAVISANPPAVDGRPGYWLQRVEEPAPANLIPVAANARFALYSVPSETRR